MFNFLFRVLFFLMGLAVAASLVVVVTLLMGVWAVRYGWARLTGRPTAPWIMRFDPRSGFERFRAAGARAEPKAGEVVAARARGEATDAPPRFRDAGGVTDVQPKTGTSSGN